MSRMLHALKQFRHLLGGFTLICRAAFVCRDGPYTSYDLNTLLKATSGTRKDVRLARSDRLDGQVSRIVVAEALVQALQLEGTLGQAFSLESVEGSGPGADQGAWRQLFDSSA